MSKNRLIINHVEDSIQLSWLRGQAAPRSAPPVRLEHPFDEKVLAELRWYLEEYLRFPYGIEPEKAKKTEQKLQNWGQQLFELVFPRTTKAWDFFQEATREGLAQCELNISSDAPTVLNLPWELIYSPDYQFLAPSLAGMYRSLNEYAVRAEMPNLLQDKLNILLVIARPYGEKDIALKTIARPLLEALKPIQKQIKLKVLRPPSFEQFERELNQHKGFYHIVHFDGHGDFDPTSQGFQHSLGGLGQGILVFEHTDGSPQIVTAAQIAQSLTDCRVPIFMLNACKSAQEGESSFSSVATRLVALGAKGVVAMAYSVYAEAAKHFIGRVYEQLVRGNNLSSAVAAGRREILNKRQRPSPKGDLPLQDWLVPVLYQQETYAPFTPSSEVALDLENFLEESTTKNLIGFPEEGAYGFVGRDYDILRLERSLRQNTVVLLQGLAGVGKTQLACGFARWLIETQGRSRCFFQSFEHGASLVNVVSQVGRAIWRDKFSQSSWEEQHTAVLNYLKTQSCLLIWDNFELVSGFSSGNEPLLLEEERKSLKQFLKQLRGGQSWVLLTSRRDESWLDCGYVLHPLRGLSQTDVEELAARILQNAGIDRKTLPPEYLELLKLLGGHSLSMRVVLPHLRRQSPTQLIEALKWGLDTFTGEAGEGREQSLIASLDYSVHRLSDLTRRHLPFLALFSNLVDINLLQKLFSEEADSGLKNSYQSVVGECLNTSNWLKLLDEVVMAGILEKVNKSIYRLHPSLSWYLRQQLKKEYRVPIENFHNLEHQLIKVYAALSWEYQNFLIFGDAELVSQIFWTDEPNLLHYLLLAEQQHAWAEACLILQILHIMYERSGRKIELKSLRQRALKQLNYSSKDKGSEAHKFWIFLQQLQANELAEIRELEQAKAIYLEILDELMASNDLSIQSQLASLNCALGVIARRQRHFDEATNRFNQALQIEETTGNNYGVSQSYFHLGIVAHDLENFDEAIFCHRKALQILEQLGADYDCARVYHELGYIAQEQKRFDEAIQHFKKALKIKEAAEDIYAASYEYHHLSMVAYAQKCFDEATRYCRKAIQIREDFGGFYHAASDYQILGSIADEQCRFDEAIAYYTKALQIYQATGDDYSTANTYHLLGSTAQKQQCFDDAFEYYIKALQIDERETGDHNRRAYAYFKLGNMAFLQQRNEDSLNYCTKALQIYKDNGVLHPVAESYYQSGRIAQQRQNFEEAIAFYLQAFLSYIQVGNPDQLADEYFKLGHIAFAQRRLEEAGEFYTKALQIYEKTGEVYRVALSYHNLGRIAQDKRQFEQAIAHYTNARRIYEEAGDTYRAADECHQLGNVAFYQQDFKKATAYYTQALQIYEEAGDRCQMADEYHQLGYVAFAQQRFDNAMTYYTQALQIREELGERLGAAYIYHQIGMVEQKQQRFDEAIDCYTKALRIKEELGDWYKSATDYHLLGTVAQEQQHYNYAIAYYQKALQIYETAEDAYHAADIIYRLGTVSEKQQLFSDAIHYYQKALQIYEASGDRYKTFGIYYRLGSITQEQHRFEEAIGFYQQALKICEDIEEAKPFSAHILHCLGVIAHEQHRSEEAISYYQEALNIYQDSQNLHSAAGTHHNLGVVAQEQQHIDKAIAHYAKALMIYISVNDEHRASYPARQLRKILQIMEERQFRMIFQQETGENCSTYWLEVIRKLGA